MMHSTSSTSNHPVDHTSPKSNHTSALNNNPAINSSLKHQQQLHPSIDPSSSQPQKTSSTTSGSIISNPPTTINSTTQSTPAAQDTDNQPTGDSIKSPVIQAISSSSSAPILPISCVQNQALHHSSSPSSASSYPLSASATTTTKITDTKLTSTFNNQSARHHNPPPPSSNNQSSSSSSLPPSSESSSSSVATATAPIAAATLPRLVTIQSVLSQHSNQPDSALASLVKDFNHLSIQLSEVQSTLAEVESGRSSTSCSASTSANTTSSKPPANHSSTSTIGQENTGSRKKLQDENRQLWAVISRSKSELNQVKSENRDLRQRVTNLESRLAILQSSDRDPGSLGGSTTRTIAPTPTGLPRSPAPSNSRSDHHQLVQQPLSPSEKKFQPINSNNLSTSELGDHRPSPSSAKNRLPANPSSQFNPSRRATEPTESSNQPLRPDQTTHRIRKQYSADPTNIQVPGSYSAASKAESSLSTSPVDDISDHLKPSSHQILRTLSRSASSEIPLNFPSSQSTRWDSGRSNTDWSPASPNPLIPPNTLNLRSDTSPQPIHSASAKLSPKLRRKASSVDMTRSAKESKDENPSKSPPKASLNNKFRLSLHPSSTSASPSNSSPNSRASYRHSIVPPEVRQLMLNHSLSPTTPLPTSHPSIRTDKIPSALGSNATATTASSDFSSTPHPLTPSTSHDHQAGDETGRLKSPNAVDSQASYAINQPIISAQRSPRAGISPTEATTPKLAVNAQNSSNSSALLPSHTVDPLYTTQPSTRRRMLTSTFLPFTKIKVTNSHIRANEKNKEVISFSINVNVVIPPESDPERKGAKASWVVEKFYSDVLALDHIVKSKHSKSQKKTLAQPPDRALFKDHAPSKVDARKAVLERYLESLCSAQLKEKGDVCEFFNSNIVINERSSPSNRPGFMQGYLTKKGRNFGGWQTRYYVLDGPVLEYFDSRGGTKLGFLGITGAQIGRQQQQRSQDASDDSYRHAFLIRMHKEKEGEVDHILCAETDEERDAWVEALTCYVSGRFVSAEGTMSTSESSNRTPTGITSSPASNGRSRRQTSLDGFNRSETSSFNPQHQSSTSQDMRGETKTKIRASGMPKSNSSNQATVSTKSDLQAPLSKAAIAEEQALPMRRSTSKERPLKQELSNVAPETRDQFSRAKSSFADHRDNLNRPKLLEDRGNQLGNPANNGPTTPRPVQARLLQQAQSSPQQDQTTSDAESALNSSIDRPHTPDPQRPKISGPMNGAPITGGYRLKPVEEKRAKFRSAFWGFGGRNAGSDRKDSRETSGSSTAALKPAPRPVFGVSLQEAVSVARVHEGLDLPAVVFRCVEFLEAKGAIEEEGIYRLSGSSVSIKAYKDRFNTEGDYNLLESSKNVYHDVHAVAGLLKQFLRELGSPILPRDLQPEFLKVIDLSQRSDKVNELGRLCAELPLPNYTLLRFLSAHLIHIVQNEKVNKMSLRNVGIVFSPTLGIPAPLFALLLREFDLVFNIEGDNRAPIKLSGDESVVNKPHGEKGGGASGDIAVSASKRLSRNSILYSATGADMLLEHSKLPRSKGNIESDSESDLDYDSSSEPDEEIIASVKSNKIAEKQQRRKTLIQPNFEVKSDLIDDSTKSPFALSAKSGGEGSSGIGKNNTTKYNGNVLSSPRPKTAGG